MITLLYTLSLYVFWFASKILSPFYKKAQQWSKGQDDVARFLKNPDEIPDKIIWMHCASLGEFEQGRPIIEHIKANYQSYSILLTFFSPSGYTIRNNYSLADYVLYLPLDLKQNAKRFVNIFKPKLAMFIKYEFWHNYLHALKEQNIPTFLISGIFFRNQIFFKFYGKWYKQLLENFDIFFVQDEQSKQLLQQINISNTIISGDTRFDRVKAISSKINKLNYIEQFKSGRLLIVAGSTWKEDEQILQQYINSNKQSDVAFIIAPHEVNTQHIKHISNTTEASFIKYSEIEHHTNLHCYKVLIIDNIGMLSSIYNFAEIAYVGGAFRTGLHNILEPACFGIPVIFGPHYKKFNEAVELVDKKGAFSINTNAKLSETIDTFITKPQFRIKAGTSCKEYIQQKSGATEIIIKYLHKYLR